MSLVSHRWFLLSRDYALIVVGAIIQAISVAVFLAPADLAPGGVSGLALILSRALPFALAVGVWVLLLNLPLFVLGMRYLGGWRFLIRTIVTVVLYGGATALLERAGVGGVTNDIVLNTLFGGIIGGIGMGLVFRAQATTGGTDILALLLVRWRSIPLSQSYLVTDAIVIALAGLIFGWERALYAVIALYVSGVAAETISEGVQIGRTAFIITQKPEEVAQAVMRRMGRGVTRWSAIGAYTGAQRPILFVVISRAETSVLKALVAQTDPQAFMVIGQAQEVYGEGFRRFEQR
ncbi:YitT family protein [Candidatus Roseilinea sp. NK_OTU-006]|uniref:YitT family protein n=1 Tax=Candidatus Roseilinea sp. NK_OTU-006 TaxID=2704250 RepID=UPI00145EDCC0|nr:YitT family protein [Candidatus Roseilinea sp. NK_OTU-006]